MKIPNKVGGENFDNTCSMESKWMLCIRTDPGCLAGCGRCGVMGWGVTQPKLTRVDECIPQVHDQNATWQRQRGKRLQQISMGARFGQSLALLGHFSVHTYTHSHTHAETVWGTKAHLLIAAVWLTVLAIVLTTVVIVVAVVATLVVVSFVFMSVPFFTLPRNVCKFFYLRRRANHVSMCVDRM